MDVGSTKLLKMDRIDWIWNGVEQYRAPYGANKSLEARNMFKFVKILFLHDYDMHDDK